MEFRVDIDSFQKPLERAIFESERAVVDAGRTVRGAAARAEQAQRERDHLRQWNERVTNVIKYERFSELPRLREGFRRIPYTHHLTVGPWRGVFLVSEETGIAIGLVFSKEPHDLGDRLGELAAKRIEDLIAEMKDEQVPGRVERP